MKNPLALFRPRILQAFIVAVIALLAVEPILEARSGRGGGGSRGGGGGGRSAGASRQVSKPSRSPVTGSRTKQKAPSRPQSRPAASRPASQPSTRPSTRPSTQPSTRPSTRPSTQPSTRPSTRPSTQPSTRPSTRPSTQPSTRPSTRPEGRPSTRPAERPSRPETKPGDVSYPRPETRPSRPGGERPSTRPGIETGERPGARPGTRPDTRPGERPGARPGDRPGSRPGEDLGLRPGGDRPSTRPSRPGDRPGFGDRPGGGDRPGIGDRPGDGGRPGDGDRPGDGRPGRDDWWDNRPGDGNRPGRDNDRVNIGNDVNVDIDNNFRNNWNYSSNRKNWGSRPWWGHPQHNHWHHGHWNGHWDNHHHHHWGHYHHHGYFPGYWDDDDDWGEAVAWGLAGWGLGNLIYNVGYQSYSNPYSTQSAVVYQAPAPASAPAPPPSYNVDYSQPLTVATEPAMEEFEAKPEEEQELAETKALESIEAARAAFKERDYVAALGKTQEALAYDPGDPVTHELRALCLFALGKYSDAAIVLNSVLASGPGWGWETMIGLYDAQSSYTDQLKALEDYAKSNAKSADAQFLLGYHYMTAGFMDEAKTAFAAASKLQPADSVSQQLLQLVSVSATGEEEEEADEAEAEAETEEEAPEPVPPPALEDLRGSWIADRGDQGTITLDINPEDKFVWKFTRGEKSNELAGQASISEGLLVLAADEAQMVGAADLAEDKKKLTFILAGGPPGDPGLNFVKKG